MIDGQTSGTPSATEHDTRLKYHFATSTNVHQSRPDVLVGYEWVITVFYDIFLLRFGTWIVYSCVPTDDDLNETLARILTHERTPSMSLVEWGVAYQVQTQQEKGWPQLEDTRMSKLPHRHQHHPNHSLVLHSTLPQHCEWDPGDKTGVIPTVVVSKRMLARSVRYVDMYAVLDIMLDRLLLLYEWIGE